MNRHVSVVLLLLFTSLSGMIQPVSAQSPAVSSDNPIRGTDRATTPSSVETYPTSDYIWWSHVTPELEINETEEVSYFFDVNQRALGSTVLIELEIVDKLWGIEPDLDLYLFDPNGDLVDYSNESGDEDEFIIAEFNMTGTWEVWIYAYEQDGPYQLYRDVFSNSAPMLLTENLNTDNPYVYDPAYIDACESYDPEDHVFTYDWYIDDQLIVNDQDNDGETDCDFEFEIDSLSPFTVAVEVTDSYGLSNEEMTTITPSNPGWNTPVVGESVSVDVDESIQFTFIDMAPSMPTPLRADGLPISLQIGLQYDIIIDSDLAVVFDYDHETDPQHIINTLDTSFNHYEQTVSFKPSILFILNVGTSTYELNIPMLSNSAVYPGQPSFSIENYSLGLYYWADFVELDTTALSGAFAFTSFDEFNLASIDLYPIVEWMIDNLAAALGQAWVDTATNLLEKLIDIAIPIEFNVDIFAYGVNFLQTKPMCDTCEIAPIYNNGPYEYENYANSTQVNFNADYNVKVAAGILSYFYVEATPHIDLSLEVNDITIWSERVFEADTLTNQYLSSNPSGSHVPYAYITDADGDGVNDDDDFLPYDATQQYDSDNDGCGDNPAGTMGDAFPNDPSECNDTDEDGVGDNADAFPNDASETVDSDQDGVGDNADAFPEDATETLDSDNDGVGNNADSFPEDATETLDSDNDGVGDNADAFPNDASETVDSDQDGVGDNADVFPEDATETMDTDGDGVGDNEQAELEAKAAAQQQMVIGVGLVLLLLVGLIFTLFRRSREHDTAEKMFTQSFNDSPVETSGFLTVGASETDIIQSIQDATELSAPSTQGVNGGMLNELGSPLDDTELTTYNESSLLAPQLEVSNEWTDENGHSWQLMSDGTHRWWNGNAWVEV